MRDREEFRVQVTKDYLVFASAHFITFAGHRCESLHGHNYRAGATVIGELDPESWYVLDFSVLKQTMRRLCDAIDHRVLLPLRNPRIGVSPDGEMVHVTYDGRPRYVFPRSDCVMLPIPNTTVEMLAQYLAGQLAEALRGAGMHRITAIEMEIEESFGQSATYREELAERGRPDDRLES